jgi:hypothetical protein
VKNRAVGIRSDTAKHHGPYMRYFGIDNARRMITLVKTFVFHRCPRAYVLIAPWSGFPHTGLNGSPKTQPEVRVLFSMHHSTAVQSLFMQSFHYLTVCAKAQPELKPWFNTGPSGLFPSDLPARGD